MKKNIVCAVSLVVLFNAAVYSIENTALKASNELVSKVFYGAQALCMHGYNKSSELMRKVPGGNAALDNYKVSLAVLGMSYIAFEYGYTKYYKKHTPILKIFAGLFDCFSTKLGCPSLENLMCCQKQMVKTSSLTVSEQVTADKEISTIVPQDADAAVEKEQTFYHLLLKQTK